MRFEMEQLRFNVLSEVYFISKGYKNTFVSRECLHKNLACKNQMEIEDVDSCCRFLMNKGLLVSRAFGTFSITHAGIKEVETIILEPDVQTPYFASYLGIGAGDERRKMVKEIRLQRLAFLNQAYRSCDGDDTKPVNGREVAQKLRYDDDTFQRIYYYLKDEGLISFYSQGGEFTITQECIKEYENRARAYNASNNLYGGLHSELDKYAGQLINELNSLNTISTGKLGYRLFNIDATIFNDLRDELLTLKANAKDKKTFGDVLLLIGKVIGDVNYADIQKHVKPSQEGSINLIQSLLDSKGVGYNPDTIKTLRQLYKLRSTIAAHKGENDAIPILKVLGITYPLLDLASAAETVLDAFTKSIKELGSSIYSHKN